MLFLNGNSVDFQYANLDFRFQNSDVSNWFSGSRKNDRRLMK